MSKSFASMENRITNMSNLINKLVGFVMEAPIAEYKENLNNLVIAVASFTGSGVNGFLYGGKLYQSDNYSKKVNKKNSFPVIPKQFLPTYFELAKEEEALQHNMGLLKQLFTVLLTGCKSEQDVRDALPEFLINEFGKSVSEKALKFIRNYERTRPEAWNILDRPQLISTVEKSLMPILAMRVVGKYLE